jgi:hypothetical protein
MVIEEHPIQVIDLVLHGLRQNALGLDAVLLQPAIACLDGHPLRPCDRAGVSRQREAALVSFVSFARLDNLGVDQDEQLSRVRLLVVRRGLNH